ncbi:MAG TPA: hypothetical protein VD790_06815 [Thermoleophilaceae bacterium]|nr:hypothetical protein [Thermoleophilaceae bacterium]
MKRRLLAQRPSPAMIVAIVALICSLSAGAVAATLITGKDIKKGAIAKKHIKKNAVVSKKVKNGSLKASDFKANQLPAGPTGPTGPAGSPDTADEVLTKLLTVDGSGSGLNADALDGVGAIAIDYRRPAASAAEPILNLHGLTMEAACDGAGDLQIVVTSGVDDGNFFIATIGSNDTVDGAHDLLLDDGQSIDIDENIAGTVAGSGSMTWVAPTGERVTFSDIVYAEGAVGGDDDCLFSGTAFHSP